MGISIILLCLILCAFFSGMEIAFVSSNKIYLELEKKQNDFFSKILTRLTDNPSKFIATMLIGNTIALVVYVFYMCQALKDLFLSWNLNLSEFVSLVFQIFITAIVVLIWVEFFTRIIFQSCANSLIKFFCLPAYFFYKVFYFGSTSLIWISDVVLKRFFKTEGSQLQSYFSKIELGDYINEQMSSVDESAEVDSEIHIFRKALDFSTTKAREVMTPRTEIEAVEVEESIEKLKQLFVETGYSKIVVFQNSLDDIIGYVHSFDLFKKPRLVKEVVIPIEFIPGTLNVRDAMSLLTKKRKSVAVVLDEYGGTSGILTIEDIVEELFGEIEDEHDFDEELFEKELDERNFLFSARLDVEYLNRTYKLSIPEEDSYETLGGFIVNYTKEIPQKDDEFTFENYRFVIVQATNKKIELVKITIND